MTEQQGTGWGIIIVILFLLWWLSKNALGFLHGDTTVVQSRIAVPGGDVSAPTVTQYPNTFTDASGCCS